MATSIYDKPCSYVRIFVDGAYSKNRMGIGVVIYIGETNKIYRELYGCVPPVLDKSNHYIAEWAAVVMGLKLAKTIEGLKQFKLFNDNLVVVNQLNGEARIRKAHLANLKNEADCDLAELEAKGVKPLVFAYISKKRNNYADALSQRAIEEGDPMLDLYANLEEIPKPKEEPKMTEELIKSEAEERAETSQKVKKFIEERKAARGETLEVQITSDVNIDTTKEELDETLEKLDEIAEQAEPHEDIGDQLEPTGAWKTEEQQKPDHKFIDQMNEEKKKKKPKSPFKGIEF